MRMEASELPNARQNRAGEVREQRIRLESPAALQREGLMSAASWRTRPGRRLVRRRCRRRLAMEVPLSFLFMNHDSLRAEYQPWFRFYPHWLIQGVQVVINNDIIKS